MQKRLIERCLILLLCALFALGLFTAAAFADGGITSWAELQTALDNGGTVTLTQDITATSDDSALTVSANVSVTLNLNGHTIDRGLTSGSATANGSVIIVNGTLTITGSGTITGGNTTGQGGGVYINNKGSFTMNGGTITGNTSEGNGAGVFVVSSATFTVNGNATVSGNTYSNDDDGSKTQNVYLGSSAYIHVGDSFTGSVGVWTKEATYIKVTETNGRMDDSFLSHFSSDRHKEYEGRTYGLGILDGEVYFGPLFDVTATSNSVNGTVTANRQKVILGGNVTLTFEPADGVSSLSVNGNNIELSNIVNGVYTCEDIQTNVTITVTFFVLSWTDLQEALNNSDTVTLTYDITAGADDSTLTVPSGKTVTLDLNGHTLSRGLTEAAADGCVIQNNGTLTITDSTGGGVITGGHNTGNGGGVFNSGTFTLKSGAITGNTAGESGGGIYNSGTMTISGGSIASNTADGWHGGGVYNGGTMNLQGGSITGNEARGSLGSGQGGGILNNGTLNVSGAPNVSGNIGVSGNNIYMRNAHRTMTVNGKLTDGANLYVTSARGADIITSMYRDYNGTQDPGSFFHADNEDYAVELDGREVSIFLVEADGYTVTVNATGYGSVTSDHATAYYGDTVKLTFNHDDEDCFVSSLTVKSANNSNVPFDSETGSFVMPASRVTVTVVFDKTRFAVTVSDSQYGSVSAPAKANVGDTVTLTVTPEENCRLVSITATADGEAVELTDNSFVMPKADVTVTPVFETSYTIAAASAIEHGTVTADKTRAFTGETVTLTPVPEDGYAYREGSLTTDSDAALSADGSFVMPSQAVTASAAFDTLEQTLNLNLSGTEFGSYKISVNGTERATVTENSFLTVRTDDVITVTFLPAADGRLDQFSVGNEHLESSIVNNAYTFIMPPSATTVSTVFETSVRTLHMSLLFGSEQYGDFTVSVNGGDSVKASETDTLDVMVGDEITVGFLPNEGYNVEVFYLEGYDGAVESHREESIVNNSFSFIVPAHPEQPAPIPGTVSINVRFGIENELEWVSYIDENGQEQWVEATVLSGAETVDYYSTSSGFYYYVALGNNNSSSPVWYAVRSGISYARDDSFKLNMELNGDVRIIVCDGAALSVQGGITGGLLSVYGQANQTGTVNAESVKSGAVNLYSCVLSVGAIDNYDAAVNVKGGALNVSGNVSCQDLNISGGVTNIAGEAGTISSLTLGCGGADDSITIGTYAPGYYAVFKITDGQTLTDGAAEYSGVLKESGISSTGIMDQMAGKTLMLPHAHVAADMMLTPAIVPTYDPETNTCTNGRFAYYTCPRCGMCFVEEGESLVPKTESELIAPYFRFRSMTIAGSALCEIIAYSGADASVVIPDRVPAGYIDAEQVGNTVTGIDSHAFENNALITDITIGDSLNAIYESAFGGCTNLARVTAGSGLGHIGDGAFTGCTSLESFTASSTGRITYNGDSFDPNSNIQFHGPHGSTLLNMAHDFGGTFIPTDRHPDPTWTWAQDYSSATATFSCGENCELGNSTLPADEVTYARIENSSSYSATATITTDGYTYTDTVNTNLFEIFVKMLTGQTYHLVVAPQSTIASIKMKLADMTGIPAEVQMLIFAGKKLADEKTSADYYIQKASTLHLIIKTYTVTFESGGGSGEMDPDYVSYVEPDYTLPDCGFTAPEGKAFKEWSVVIGDAVAVTKEPGDTITVTADTTAMAVWEDLPAFGEPDFVIPAGVTTIEDGAFEGIAATIVEIPANCTSIGDYAFRNCAYLTQIRIPEGCALGEDVFDGCAKVYVFGAAGSPAETYCSDPAHDNCVFVRE